MLASSRLGRDTPHLHIVENNVDFQEKIRHVLHAIHETLGDDPATFTDIRRRFLVQVRGEIPLRCRDRPLSSLYRYGGRLECPHP